ncbi:glycoside hydrolase [Aeromicrobium sp.]|nr:glycoside hydrolase [Candidatus Saccharibacteria bacterium]
MQDKKQLLTAAKTVLKGNDRGNYTMPAPDLYPHQWLWDSCFTAIGLRHLDIDRAKLEITSLLAGQWHNGMLPNIIFRSENRYAADRNAWNSRVNPESPDHLSTSGITQPPMLAEAIVQIGSKLKASERRSWYKTTWPALLAYHQWLYEDRDPHDEGLVLLVHPWEAGLDNTPPWTTELREHLLPGWIRLLKSLGLLGLVGLFRRDTQHVPIDERYTTIEVLALFDGQRRLRRKAYVTDKIIPHALFSIEDLTFNSILVRANEHVIAIAKDIRVELPDELVAHIRKTRRSLEELWDPYAGQYFSRDFVTHNLIKEPSIAAFMPLYAGSVSKERARQIVALLENDHLFGTAYPVPSVPLNSKWFDAKRYWQGPTWVNTNWLIIDGLKRYGYDDHAAALTEMTLEMVSQSGFAEYFNPLTGAAAGANNFSWTAALTIDLLKT